MSVDLAGRINEALTKEDPLAPRGSLGPGAVPVAITDGNGPNDAVCVAVVRNRDAELTSRLVIGAAIYYLAGRLKPAD